MRSIVQQETRHVLKGIQTIFFGAKQHRWSNFRDLWTSHKYVGN